MPKAFDIRASTNQHSVDHAFGVRLVRFDQSAFSGVNKECPGHFNTTLTDNTVSLYFELNLFNVFKSDLI